MGKNHRQHQKHYHSLSLSHDVNTLTIKKPCYLSPLCFALMFDVCKRKADTIEDESRAFWRPKNEAFSFYQTSVSEIISAKIFWVIWIKWKNMFLSTKDTFIIMEIKSISRSWCELFWFKNTFDVCTPHFLCGSLIGQLNQSFWIV